MPNASACIYLPEDLLRWVDQQAMDQDRSRSAVVVRALQAERRRSTGRTTKRRA